ncbi:MAG TPA: murein transglycosylase A [Thermoanaerobaculia bacterium]|nr:murein transglycosylase A [Thermoanaerobaculia bacterium]
MTTPPRDGPRPDETTRRTVTPPLAPPRAAFARGPSSGSRWRAFVTLLLLLWALGATAFALWLWRERPSPTVVEAPVAEPPPTEPLPDRRVLAAARFEDLPGWHDDRHAEVLPALRRTCARFTFLGSSATVRPSELGGKVADWLDFCQRATALERELAAGGVPVEEHHTRVRELLEAELQPFQVRNRDREVGLFTGYYEPLLRGSRRRGGDYQVPLYRRPADLVAVDLGEFREALRGQRIAGRLAGDRLVPYPDRTAIDDGALAGRRLELLWVDDAVDAFFLQIQGSGQVELEDGSRVRVGYDGQNGHPYFAIGRDLVERGALVLEEVSMQSIAAWLRANPRDAPAVTARNASYVFFRELQGEGPIGSQSVALTPERSLAVDTSFLPLGAPVWLDTTHPLAEVAPPDAAAVSPAGAGQGQDSSPHEISAQQTSAQQISAQEQAQNLPLFRRLLIAQDTGGAIRGPVRGDVFWGAGERAEAIAGRMRSEGRLWVLLPRALATRLAPDLFEVERPQPPPTR